MKSILDLTKAITDPDYYASQFYERAKGKNILFVEPQLSSKHLYKFLLPFFSFYTENIYTAITEVKKYNPLQQIAQIRPNLTVKEIQWADFIVFPFTAHDLTKENGYYQAIRETKGRCLIVFYVDFNFYELPKENPYYELFQNKEMLDNVERNILFADLCMTTNMELNHFLFRKMQEIAVKKVISMADIPVQFGCVPYLIDKDITTQNIEFEGQSPVKVINKDIFKKIAHVADEMKKKDIEEHPEKKEKIAKKAGRPKKADAKSKKVKNKTEHVDFAEAGAVGATGITGIGGNMGQTGASAPETPQEKKLKRKFRVGVIYSNNHNSDYKYFNDIFQSINSTYGDEVDIVIVGYDPADDKDNVFDGVNYEYVKPVTIIHYFKQISSLNLDFIFIPLENNIYNATSENTNKYLESGIFGIPILAPNIFPYNKMIVDRRNGFIYEDKIRALTYMNELFVNEQMLKGVGGGAYRDVTTNFSYSPVNIEVMSDVFR